MFEEGDLVSQLLFFFAQKVNYFPTLSLVLLQLALAFLVEELGVDQILIPQGETLQQLLSFLLLGLLLQREVELPQQGVCQHQPHQIAGRSLGELLLNCSEQFVLLWLMVLGLLRIPLFFLQRLLGREFLSLGNFKHNFNYN